jgi:hypothetical protein
MVGKKNYSLLKVVVAVILDPEFTLSNANGQNFYLGQFRRVL